MADAIGFSELAKLSFYRALVAEFIATLLFLYITLLTVIGSLSQADMHPCTGVGVLGIAWSFGGMIFILIYCTVDISGGHINPAVTLAMLLAGKVTLVRAVMYMVVQCLGAICGAGLVKAYHKANYKKYGGGANVVAPGYSSGVGLAAEIVGTFILVNTVFSVPDPEEKAKQEQNNTLAKKDSELKMLYKKKKGLKILAPLPIGFSVFMIHLATIPITGTGINPARSFGPAVMYNKEKAWDDQWIFWVGPFIGAAIAAIYHKFILRTGARA